MEMPSRPIDVWETISAVLSDGAVRHMREMLDAAENALLEAGEELQYVYSPGDGRGRRYVFRNKTCVGLAAARQYVQTCLVNASQRKDRDGNGTQAAVEPPGASTG